MTQLETTAKEIAENIKLGAQARADAEAEESGKIDKLLDVNRLAKLTPDRRPTLTPLAAACTGASVALAPA